MVGIDGPRCAVGRCERAREDRVRCRQAVHLDSQARHGETRIDCMQVELAQREIESLQGCRGDGLEHDVRGQFGLRDAPGRVQLHVLQLSGDVHGRLRRTQRRRAGQVDAPAHGEGRARAQLDVARERAGVRDEADVGQAVLHRAAPVRKMNVVDWPLRLARAQEQTTHRSTIHDNVEGQRERLRNLGLAATAEHDLDLGGAELAHMQRTMQQRCRGPGQRHVTRADPLLGIRVGDLADVDGREQRTRGIADGDGVTTATLQLVDREGERSRRAQPCERRRTGREQDDQHDPQTEQRTRNPPG